LPLTPSGTRFAGLSSLVNESWQLLLTFSVVMGLGHSLALFSAVMTTNQWFSRRLALAHAFGSTGGAASPFLSGLLTPQLADGVGWRNALRVFAAVNCGVLLVAAQLLPLPPQPPEEEEEEDIEVMNLNFKAEAVLADASQAPNPLKAGLGRDARFPELISLLRRNRPLQVRGVEMDARRHIEPLQTSSVAQMWRCSFTSQRPHTAHTLALPAPHWF